MTKRERWWLVEKLEIVEKYENVIREASQNLPIENCRV